MPSRLESKDTENAPNQSVEKEEEANPLLLNQLPHTISTGKNHTLHFPRATVSQLLLLSLCLLVVLYRLASFGEMDLMSFTRKQSKCDRPQDKELPFAVLFMNQTVLQARAPFGTGGVGNHLSPYWAARTLAELGGYGYQYLHELGGTPFGKGTFVEFLPTKVAATGHGYPRELQEFLCACPRNLENMHEKCDIDFGLNGAVVESIRRDTQKALQQFASIRLASQPEEQEQMLGNFYQPRDWLIYDRCCLLDHPIHGFATLKAYDALPLNGTYTIYTLSGRPEGPGGKALCEELHAIRDAYLKARNPHVTIQFLNQSAIIDIDFGRIVFAPNLFVPSAGTSWSLWAKLANSGRVVTVPNIRDDDPSHAPRNFQVLTNATVLYPPHALGGSGHLLGFDDPQEVNTPEGKQKLLDCYRNC